MERDQFVRRLRALGIKQTAFADMVGLSRVTLYGWGRVNPFPAWVDVLLTAWERVAVLERLQGEQFRKPK